MDNREQALSRQFKQHRGPFTNLDYSELDCASAHYCLGQDARAQIEKILSKRLDELGGAQQAAQQMQRARNIRRALQAKKHSPALNESIKNALIQYIASLSAWAGGARLADFRHASLPGAVDGLDLAMFLQEDEVGCQTGAYRERDGSVILWHAEEDVETAMGQRFDRLRLFSFRAAADRISTAFIYPDLLPGPSFGWQDGDFAQAIDTLHVNSVDFEDGILPNTLTWISLYLGAQVSRQELARQLGPFLGGYSLTALARKDGRVEVEKVEYANDQLHCSALGQAAGANLFQTNIISDLSLTIGAQEHTSAESRAWNEKRIARTARFMTVVQRAPEARPMIFRMLRSALGGDSAYSNRDVKAYLVCQMQPKKTSVWAGHGAALKDDQLSFSEVITPPGGGNSGL